MGSAWIGCLHTDKHCAHATSVCLQYYERLSDMLQLAANIPHHQLQGMAVAVLLGSSVQRPREVYCLHFPATMHPLGETAQI
jgi:hypothetical protein